MTQLRPEVVKALRVLEERIATLEAKVEQLEQPWLPPEPRRQAPSFKGSIIKW